MAERGVDLSGRWSGVYFYPTDAEMNPSDDWPPTPFTADLVDRGGFIEGRSEENSFDADGIEIVFVPAALEGSHQNGVLTFTKSPQGGGHIHTIDYAGTISGDGNSIAGDWIIYGEWSGTFRMQRSDVGATEAIEREAAV